MELEKDIEKACCAYATKRGVHFTKMAAPGQRGFVDRVFWIKGGSPLLVEMKRPDGVVSKQQQATIKRMQGLSYKVLVVYSLDQFKEILDAELEAAHLSKTR